MTLAREETLQAVLAATQEVLAATGSAKAPSSPVVWLAAAPLPAAGAWTTPAAAFPVPASAKRISFQVDYTGAASGGQVKYRVRKGFSSTLASMGSEQIVVGGATPSGLTASRTSYDDVMQRPVSDTTATHFPVDIDIDGWTHVVLELAECGVTGSPGTAAITVAVAY